MQGVSGSAVGTVRGSASLSDSDLTTNKENGVVKLLQRYCGMCQVQCPRNDEVEVKNGVSCKSGMRQRGVAE
eukprot:238561-Karenia_brevis.AAC.1